jgi:hypothetical protein
MAYTLNNTDLGACEEKEYEITTDLDVQGYAMSGSKETEALDYSGVTMVIKISGTVTAANVGALFTNFVAPVALLQNGAQEVVIFHSQMLDDANVATFYPDGNVNVKVRRFTPRFKKGDVGMSCTYDLELVESI